MCEPWMYVWFYECMYYVHVYMHVYTSVCACVFGHIYTIIYIGMVNMHWLYIQCVLFKISILVMNITSWGMLLTKSVHSWPIISIIIPIIYNIVNMYIDFIMA